MSLYDKWYCATITRYAQACVATAQATLAAAEQPSPEAFRRADLARAFQKQVSDSLYRVSKEYAWKLV